MPDAKSAAIAGATAVNPVLGLGLAGLNALGSALGANSQAKLQAKQAEQEKRRQQQVLAQNYQQLGNQDRQFAQNSNLDRQKVADERLSQASATQQLLNANPLKDQAAYMLAQRLGVPAQAFQARDFTRGTIAGHGAASGGTAPTLAQMAAAAGRYTPGAGGMDDSALRAQLAGLQDTSQMPEMYKPVSANEMFYQAEAQRQGQAASEDKYAKDRVARQNELDLMAERYGIAPEARQSVATQQDVRQAEIDKLKKSGSAEQRIMALLGILPSDIPSGVNLGQYVQGIQSGIYPNPPGNKGF